MQSLLIIRGNKWQNFKSYFSYNLPFCFPKLLLVQSVKRNVLNDLSATDNPPLPPFLCSGEREAEPLCLRPAEEHFDPGRVQQHAW